MVTTSRGILYPATSDAITPLANHFANLATTTNTALDNLDNATGYFVGTDGQRSALAAPKLRKGITWRATDTNKTWTYDGTNWVTGENGMYLIEPTSVSGTGVTVSDGKMILGTSGDSFTVNGVFSNRFRSYRIVSDWQVAGGVNGATLVFAAGGTANTSNNYYQQSLISSGSSTSSSYNAASSALSFVTLAGTAHSVELLVQRPAVAGRDTYFSGSANIPTAGYSSYGGFFAVTSPVDGFRVELSSKGAGRSWNTGQFAVYGLA